MMKKKNVFCFLVLVCACFSIALHSCSKEDSQGMPFPSEENVFLAFGADDTIEKETLSIAYDLTDLKSYFQAQQINEKSVAEEGASALSLSNAKERFPDGILRTKGYSIFKVKQGGYYYAFWVPSVLNGASFESSAAYEPTLYFSAYIFANRDRNEFDSLNLGTHNVSAVRSLDPWLELNFCLSNGIYSYSFLNENEMLEIRYRNDNANVEEDQLIVERIALIPRSEGVSCYSRILLKDLV